MFEECGIEVYKTMGSVWVEEEGEQNTKRMSSIIQVRASIKQLQQQLYAIYQAIHHLFFFHQLNLEDIVQSQQVHEWVNHVQATIGGLTREYM